MALETGTLADPATIAMGLGALAGLVAAIEWAKVWRVAGKVSDSRQWAGQLSQAALITALALALASGGYLFGQLVGRT